MPQSPWKQVFTPFKKPFSMPFYYDAVSFFWTYFSVPMERVEPHLTGTGLTAARFTDLETDDHAIVSLNFQNYLSNLGMLLTTVLEVEFNIHCFPTSKEHETPLMSFREYLMGQEQTKWIGGFRLHVPADDEIAVKAGTLMFGERKFKTGFTFNVPVANNPNPPKGEEWRWVYTVFDPSVDVNKSPNSSDFIYRLKANLDHLGRPTMTNPSPLTLYSLLPGGKDHPPGFGTLNLSRWNIFGFDKTWFDTDKSSWTDSHGHQQPVVKVECGESTHAMRKDTQDIIGDIPACAVRYYQSPPAAVENRAFWADGPKPD